VFDYTRGDRPWSRVGYASGAADVVLTVTGPDGSGVVREIVVERAIVNARRRTVVREGEVILAYLPVSELAREVGPAQPDLYGVVRALTGVTPAPAPRPAHAAS